MKKVVLLLLVLSLVSFAKPVKHSSQKKQSTAEAVEPAPAETVAESVSENETSVNDGALETAGSSENESLVDSIFTLYIHPMNFIAPYSHFWGGFNVPNGVTDYPSLNLTFEWKLFEKSSLVTMPHYVRVDRSDYKIYDIGLQESYRWYGVGGRWRYLEAGLLLSHLHVKSDNDGRFDGWLYGFMINGGVKKILNGGEGFWGRFALSVDVGIGYVWTSDFEAERDRAYFKMDKGFVIDVNAAFGFQI
ncbi:MAG: hypothetical protein IKS96_08160 [Fibrobacter sp.]|nr:hypothetical protein [Fibrobacter sp.]